MCNLHIAAKTVSSREDYIRFLEQMASDFRTNKAAWENQDVSAFLEAMASWIEDMDGYYLNQKMDVPADINWRFMTDVLMAARVYE
ncbi:MAG: hypothetical protein WC708_13425 [Lentisphaeria bacterium]